jgi:hypothetical protein
MNEKIGARGKVLANIEMKPNYVIPSW